MSKPVIAFIGTGMMGQLAHLANYARLRDAGECEISGVTDLKPALAQAVAARYGIPRVYSSAADLLSDPEVDAVVCIQQWPNNYALVKAILEAEKSVITEKPMLGRLDQAEELSALAEANGVLYTVGFMKRYDTGVEIARKLVDEFRRNGELGPLLTVDSYCDGGDWLHHIEPHLQVEDPTPVTMDTPTYPDSCSTPHQQAAYNYLLNIFSHNINLCHFLLGEEMTPRFAQFHQDKAMNAALRCGNILVTVRGASSSSHEWREGTTLRFSQGEIFIKTPTPMNRQQSAEVSLLRRDPVTGAYVTTRYHPPIEWAFFRQARGFVRALTSQEPLRSPAETCTWDVRVMEHIIQMAEIV